MSTSAFPLVETPDVSSGVPIVRTESTAPVARSAQPSMTDLLFIAVEKGTPVDQLKELVALHASMEERQARKNYTDAMARFQAECPSIKKGHSAKFATNSGTSMSYTYASLDEIARIVNPILARHGLSYTWDSKVDGATITCVCTVSHVDGHFTTSTIELPTETKSAMSSQQKVGSALTFARRLSLTSALGLTTTDDDIDGRDLGVETITQDQADTLKALLEETRADEAAFLKYCRVRKLSDIPASKYKGAVRALESKRSNA